MFHQISNSPETIIGLYCLQNMGLNTVYLGWANGNLKTEEIKVEQTSLDLNSESEIEEFRKWVSSQTSKLIFLDSKDFAHQIGLFSSFPKNIFDIKVGLELGNFNNLKNTEVTSQSTTTQKPTVSPLDRGTGVVENPEEKHPVQQAVHPSEEGNIPSEDKLKPEFLIKTFLFLQQNLPEKIFKLWAEIESPLSLVLAKMENDGAYINRQALQETDTQLTLKANGLQQEILQKFTEILTGIDASYISQSPINLNSPAQLGQALKQAGYLLKETKTGKISTDRAVLEELLLTDTNNLIQPILDYRTVAKLSSTYTQTFLQVLDENSRIHTQYNQLGSATGRISSNNPNLQNIPIRNPEYGPLIRACFSAEKGNSLICADYSQIELRLLAHFCGDEVLTQAFELNQDIHQRTASEIFDIPLDQVTKQHRRLGKTLNFALVYQQGSFATAVQLGITQKEAAAFINKYFAKFSKVKPFIESTIASAKETGYVETLFGRRRYFENLNSSMVMLRKIDERAAFNAVLQGSNADLIKKAMIKLHQVFESGETENINKLTKEDREILVNSKKLNQAKIILQVHDELVIEAPTEIAVQVAKIVEEIMQLNQPLKVPILVEAGIGTNWKEGKE
jgi:DNA polymerase I